MTPIRQRRKMTKNSAIGAGQFHFRRNPVHLEKISVSN